MNQYLFKAFLRADPCTYLAKILFFSKTDHIMLLRLELRFVLLKM